MVFDIFCTLFHIQLYSHNDGRGMEAVRSRVGDVQELRAKFKDQVGGMNGV